jgi:predicted DNA-binding transcriptional regulator AlpA
MADKIQRRVYTVKEVSQMIGLNLPATYELVRRPDFPAIRVSKARIVIPKVAFHNWLAGAGNKAKTAN